MLKGIWEKASDGDPAVRKAIEEGDRRGTAVGRIGQPEEAASAAVRLCSEASSCVVGHSPIVDGEITASCHSPP